MRKQQVPIVTALFEVNELIEIYKNLAGTFDDALVKHVKAYIGGPTSYIDEDVVLQCGPEHRFRASSDGQAYERS
ncbi:MAG: hypothetical protein ACT4QB_14035 [Gammaproteobacteria bacterium]